MQFYETVRHHREVGHDIVLAKKPAEGLHHLGNVGVRLQKQLLELALGLITPMPRVLERLDLRLLGVALGAFEQNVVGRIRVKGRVEVDEVDALILNAFTEDIETVPEVELVLFLARHSATRSSPNAPPLRSLPHILPHHHVTCTETLKALAFPEICGIIYL